MILRRAFDALERPVSKVTDDLIRTDAFLDALALGWRLSRSGAQRVESGAATWLRLWGLPTRADMAGMTDQVARLQRELRDLRRELESR
jgi:hypothetical protein